jgi:hypothetical protein
MSPSNGFNRSAFFQSEPKRAEERRDDDDVDDPMDDPSPFSLHQPSHSRPLSLCVALWIDRL